MNAFSKIRVLVVGYGSIGRRHTKNLVSLGIRHLSLHRRSSAESVETVAGVNIPIFVSYKEALAERPDVVIVANPTSLHLETAFKAASAGCHLFIEKPLGHRLEGTADLINKCREKGLYLHVAYNLRFHPVLMKLKSILKEESLGKLISAKVSVGSYLPDWHPEVDYRESYSAKTGLGGGVLLDLSHELDYTYWLFGETKDVLGLRHHSQQLEIETEDYVTALLRQKNGMLIEIHLDYLNHRHQREGEVIGNKGSAHWNLRQNEIRFHSLGKEEVFHFDAYDPNKMYLDEMSLFLSCLSQKKDLPSDLNNGLKALQLAEAIRHSDELSQKWVSLKPLKELL